MLNYIIYTVKERKYMSYKPKVVFAFVEAGMGHIAPATAISDAFEKKYGQYCDVVRSKFFTEDQDEDLIKVQEGIIKDTKRQASSKLYGAFMDVVPKMIGGKLSRNFTDNFFRKGTKKAIDKIRKMNADLIMSTYCFTSHYAIRSRKKYNLNTLVATYIPDPMLHMGWDREGDLLFTCNNQAYRLANKKKHKDKVFEVPFVLRKEASEIKESKLQMREKLGLPKDKFTILLCDGAYGQKNLKNFTEELVKLDHPLTVIAVCGKNQELFNHFQSIKSSANKNITFIPMGFANNMLELNCAADLFVGKGGANAICEAFYFDSPAIVSSYANHLERGISNYYIKKQNLGEIIFNKKKFIDKIEEILNQKDWHDKYEVSLQKMKNDSGAEKVADILFDELVKQYPKLKLV